MRPRQHQVIDGIPYTVEPRFNDVCCDCGLTHRNRIRVLDAQGQVIRGATVEITTMRAPRLTAYERRRQGMRS